MLERYVESERDVNADNLRPDPEYPNGIEIDFHNLIQEIFNIVYQEVFRGEGIPDIRQNAKPDDIAEYEDEIIAFESMYQMGTMAFTDIDRVARDVYSDPKVIWAFTKPFKEMSVRFAKDIAFVKYQNLDHSGFKARLWVGVLYLIGFVLLFKQTAETFVRLIINFVF